MAGLDSIKNFGQVTVLGSHSASDFAITLVSGDGAKLPIPPTDNEFNLVWWNYSSYLSPIDDPKKELVRVTSRVGDVLVLANNGVTRTAQEGTSTSTKNNSGCTYKMALVITKKIFDDITAALSDLSNLPENLSSQCNGVNMVFATSADITSVLWLSLNGGMLIEGLDFTITDDKEITLSTTTPDTGEALYIKYV